MRLTIKTKLAASFGAVLVLLAGAGTFGVTSLSTINDGMQDFAKGPFVQVQAVQSVDVLVADLRRVLLRYTTADDGERATLRKEYDGIWSNAAQTLARYRSGLSPEQAADGEAMQASIAELRRASDDALAIAEKADPNLSERGLTETRAPAEAVMAALDAIARQASSASDPARADRVLTSLGQSAAEARLDMISAVDFSGDADIATNAKALTDLDTRTKALINELRTLVAPVAAADVERLSSAWGTLAQSAGGFAQLGVENWNARALQAIAQNQQPAAERTTAIVREAIRKAGEAADQSITSSAERFDTTRLSMIALVLAAIAIGAGAAAWISLSISRGLGRSVKLAEDIGAGDLTRTAEVRGHDEIADLTRAMNTMVMRLREFAGDVIASSSQVAAGSNQSAGTAEQLSQGASEQAATSEQLSSGAAEQSAATSQASAAMEEMSANIRQNADNASQTEKMARLAAENANRSGQAVRNSLEAMRQIAQRISVVQEIARQTDLLALNAAIEAARAGSHGKGFAVVASEVRKLAERSALAAGEIGDLSQGTLRACEDAGERLDQLVPDIRRTSELVSEISAACREQTVGAEQVNQAIQQLDQVTQQTSQAITQLDSVTQQNAGAANEMAATAEQLSAEAQCLLERASFFRLGDEAMRPAPVAAPKVTRGDARALQAELGRIAAPAPKAAPKPAAKAAPRGFDLSLGTKDDGFERMSA
ncbi:methyl-accepting chemotaxis protein [Aureimonas sp. AU4]|uniref:HAMP domain-containing methyl-accepting chemotaxis protein n=1 Tax=Aureimonas sp. AU4 TaxID=1638163 RepID=UPI00078362B5|nr:methyl-accepting chemotaxis protein [Aureimonas sp. AU4]